MSYDLLSDEILLKLLLSSDEKAFEALYHRHLRFVFRTALKKVRNAEISEDITQQVFLSIWKRRQLLKIDCLVAYLGVAVKYQCITYFESKYAKIASIDLDELHQRTDQTTEDTIHYVELRNAIETAMDMLPQKTREIFQLSRFQSQSNREIAAILKISEKSVEYHITQSLKIMRRELRDYLQPGMYTALLIGQPLQ